MTPEVITATIDALAAKLAIPADKLFELLPRVGVKQAYIFHIALAVFVVALVIALVLLVAAYMTENEVVGFISGCFFVVVIIALITIVATVVDYFFWKNEPEAWALDYILQMFQGPRQ